MTVLTTEQYHHWHHNGWLLLTEVFTPEVAQALTTWVDDLATEPTATDCRLHYYELTTHGKALCRTERFLTDHPYLHRFMVEGMLPSLASALLGETAVLYKEKINHKLAGGAGYAPHQDAAAYPHVTHHVTCLVAVDAMTLANGCLEFAPGHAEGLLPRNEAGCLAPQVAQNLSWMPVCVPAGGVLFFSSYAPHRSGANHTAAPRRALYLTYNAASAGDVRTIYYQERAQQLAALAAMDATESAARLSTIGHFLGRRVDH
jgi:ectoine hydroxylase-related dioxygenase (phytanoyl-CoA dioxygenase family)